MMLWCHFGKKALTVYSFIGELGWQKHRTCGALLSILTEIIAQHRRDTYCTAQMLTRGRYIIEIKYMQYLIESIMDRGHHDEALAEVCTNCLSSEYSFGWIQYVLGWPSVRSAVCVFHYHRHMQWKLLPPLSRHWHRCGGMLDSKAMITVVEYTGGGFIYLSGVTPASYWFSL